MPIEIDPGRTTARILPAPAAPSPTVLRRALDAVLPLVGPPAPALPPARRRALAGRLFPEAPQLVAAAARGLLAVPGLFAGLAVSGADLAARQARAEAWRDLRDCLQHLAAQAHDHYLQEQGSAVADTLALLRHVEGAAASRVDPSPVHADRREALGEAFAVLARFRGRGRTHALKRPRRIDDPAPITMNKDAP